MEINQILQNVPKALEKKPFTRGGDSIGIADNLPVEVGSLQEVTPPTSTVFTISQDRYLAELDPARHEIHRDTNVPSIIAKVRQGSSWGWTEIKDRRIALAYQKNIVNKQTQYLCGETMKFTLCNTKPSEKDNENFITIKEEWINKNMDVVKSDLVKAQKSCGDAAAILYFDDEKKVQARVFSYIEGYTLVPHYDRYNKMEDILIYYRRDNVEHIDIYDKTMFYSIVKGENEDWRLQEYMEHGFSEVPVVYKRGEVAWEDAQSIIEVLEIIYNIYTVIMKRHGWGLLYIKGKIDEKLKKTAGAVVLNDPNAESQGDAKYLTPNTPEGMENLIKDLREQIQIQAGVVFLTPNDIKIGSELSGVALKMMLNSAYERALIDVREYDDVADKLTRLFVYGLGIELGRVSEFNKLRVRGEFRAWLPQSDSAIVQDIVSLRGQKSISIQTAAEKSPYSAPDEARRILSDIEQEIKFEQQKTQKQQTNTNTQTNQLTED